MTSNIPRLPSILRCTSIWGPYLQSFVVNHLDDLILTSAAATCAEKFLETWLVNKGHSTNPPSVTYPSGNKASWRAFILTMGFPPLIRPKIKTSISQEGTLWEGVGWLTSQNARLCWSWFSETVIFAAWMSTFPPINGPSKWVTRLRVEHQLEWGGNPKIGDTPRMDGENNGKPY